MDTKPVAARRSRWSDDPKLDKNGNPVPIRVRDTDLDIFKLLAPSAAARKQWGYPVLPSTYFAKLLERGDANILDRISDLTRKPHRYLVRPEQPRNNYRPLIYALGKAGADELRNEGYTVPWAHPTQLAHALMASIIAASIEYGARLHALAIEAAKNESSIRPDWPVFTIDGFTYFIEADMHSESLTSGNSGTITIKGKFEAYLAAIDDGTIKRPRILFVTTRAARVDSMIALLRNTIDEHGYPYHYADAFCFNAIKYDRYMNTIPALTDWTIAEEWRRAHKDRPVFCIKEKAAANAAA